MNYDYDCSAALHEILFDLNRLIVGVEGLMLKQNIPDKEALEIGWADLVSAKDMLILALTKTEGVH